MMSRLRRRHFVQKQSFSRVLEEPEDQHERHEGRGLHGSIRGIYEGEWLFGAWQW